jgi:protein involved in polysaccharide export with SLBB domain
MRLPVMVLLGCTLLGCKHQAPVPDTGRSSEVPAAEAPTSASTLGPGDVFEVRVFQEPDLSGVYRLSSDGSINFPLCGHMELGGLSVAAATDQFTKCLSAGYLRNPHVSLFIKEYNSKKVFVFGEVQKAGTFQYEDGMNIVQAITLAGGFSQRAARNSTSVIRKHDGVDQKIPVAVEDIGLGRADNFMLHPGDIIFVPESMF